MKPRGIELSIAKPWLRFFAAIKAVLLLALVILFLFATLSLYTNISARYYHTNPHPPFLRIPSHSSSSSSSSSPPTATSSSRGSSLDSDSISFHHLLSPPPPILDPPSFISPDSPTNPLSSSPPALSSSSSSSSSFPPPAPTSLTTSTSDSIPVLLISSPPTSKLDQTSSSSPSSNSTSLFQSASVNFSNLTISSSSFTSSSSSHTNLSSSTAPKFRKKGLPKGCDLSKGEWVPDPKAPYYTNNTCWTIQDHQNCMKYGRPNLDFLKWRWKPDGCKLPLFEPADFLEMMRGKNLAFIGDSLARNQMQSLICLLSRVEYPQEVWPNPADNATQMFYPNHNFTIWTFWSPFLIRANEFMTSNNWGMWNLYLDEPDPLWQPHLGKFHHIVLNTGNWFTRPAHFHEKRHLIGCHYCVVKTVPFMSVYKAHRRAFRTALDAVVGNEQGFRGVTVVRTVSPSHFEGGEWNKGGDCRRTRPLERGQAKLKGMDLELYKDQLKEFWKAKWEGSEMGLEFRLLDTTKAMLMRPDGHPSKYGHWPHEKRVLYNDCVHWCLPGPADMWNDLLFQVLSI